MSENMIETIREYFATQPIEKAWLFGSYARGEETPLSDVDILVQYDGGGISLLKHASMLNELEKILDRPVDLVEDGTLRPLLRICNPQQEITGICNLVRLNAAARGIRLGLFRYLLLGFQIPAGDCCGLQIRNNR